MTTQVAVVGATGRMGQQVIRIIDATDDLSLFAGLNSRSELSEMIGADVVIDLTVPAVSQSVVEFAIEHGIKVLVGTSGWSAERLAWLERRVAEHEGAGVIVVPNFSIGSVLATSFATMAARFYDSIEIIEAHHASKVDSPSGTAVRTAELIGRARSHQGPVIAPHADQRARGQQVASVPIHSLRMQGVVARQDVHFGALGELLTITHETLSPDSYERGILAALRATPGAVGVTVGLDALIDLSGNAAE
ncbi:4-hydroxy-tetrahydrodipicolinate reductase [Galbitalea soli]|uniref:4-hydroxy-tetrahydrodipicolinate reductase n=1 Tax=Galbitalea soli TaxID=1268042 RepID=A0A7C9TPW6_9MICO|nr:4-hydroxy-tetrahydrodipicolinate reductase [Galbitalea soli]NYJ31070.1 4-hydroxy-tetrahydrodipicolinate reductase [Galbitalea soli]